MSPHPQCEDPKSILALLGISPKRLHENSAVKLPPIASLDVDNDWFKGGDVVSEAQQLQDLINRSEETDNDNLVCLAEATVLVTTDEFMRMCVTHIWPGHQGGELTHI